MMTPSGGGTGALRRNAPLHRGGRAGRQMAAHGISSDGSLVAQMTGEEDYKVCVCV